MPLTSSSFTVPGTRRWDLSKKKKKKERERENTVDGRAESFLVVLKHFGSHRSFMNLRKRHVLFEVVF